MQVGPPLGQPPRQSPGRRRPRYRIVDGFRMPLGFPPEGLRSGRDYAPQRDDIFVATYPKCGTTWTQHIIYMLVRERRIEAGETIRELFPHLEEVGREFVERSVRPRLIKTHLPLPIAPFSPSAKFVYVARNPFDCAVSFYHHTRGFPRHYEFTGGTFDEFFEAFVTGEVDFGDYFAHLHSWIAVASDANVCFLTYERLKQDIDGAIEAIGAFIGGRAEEIAADPVVRASIVAETSFERMSSAQERWSSKRPADMPQFLRKGVVGDWVNHFSVDQLRRLLRRVERELHGTPLLSIWSELLDDVRRYSDDDADQ